MKVIVIAGLDATNFEVVNITKELFRRGHYITIFAKSLLPLNIRMFDGIISNIFSLNKLDEFIKSGKVDEYDCFLCANDTMKHLLECRKYIFAWTITSVFGTYLSEGGDFLFSIGKLKYEGKYKEICANMPVGSPKFDIKHNCKSNEHKEKKFLFIDSGHYPYGDEGKKELALLLINICMKFPEYELVVKPRFLVKDKGRTHLNKKHLYTIIKKYSNGNIPHNMTLLQDYGDMSSLISNSETVICMYTSAFLDAIVQDKGLIIIGHLPNNDSRDMRVDWHWRIAEEECNRSGCLVDYKEVLSYLPKGKKPIVGYKDTQIALIGNSSSAIVDTMEYVYEKMISQGRFPTIKEYEYGEKLIEDNLLSWEKLVLNRKINYLLYSFTRFIDSVDYRLDTSLFDSWIEDLRTDINIVNVSLDELLLQMHKIIDTIIMNNENQLRINRIAESIYLEVARKYNKEKVISTMDVDGKEGRYIDYYKALVYLEMGNMKKAVNYYKLFLKKVEGLDYYEYSCDMNYNYIFPFHLVKKDSAVAIYGAGKIGKKYLNYVKLTKYAKIVCFIDQNAESIGMIDAVPVLSLENLANFDVDYVIVSLGDVDENRTISNNILQETRFKNKVISYYL